MSVQKRRAEQPDSERRLALRNGLALARWLMVRVQHPVCLFFLGPRCRVRVGGSLRVGRAVRFLSDAVVDAYGVLEIGDDVYFAQGVMLSAFDRITIGDHCLFGEYASVHDNDHGLEGDEPVGVRPRLLSPVTIGRNVWIGAKVTITRGVTIGDDAVVAANAVVTRDVPGGTIVGGAPARPLR